MLGKKKNQVFCTLLRKYKAAHLGRPKCSMHFIHFSNNLNFLPKEFLTQSNFKNNTNSYIITCYIGGTIQ